MFLTTQSSATWGSGSRKAVSHAQTPAREKASPFFCHSSEGGVAVRVSAPLSFALLFRSHSLLHSLTHSLTQHKPLFPLIIISHLLLRSHGHSPETQIPATLRLNAPFPRVPERRRRR